jgi:capsular polysaccharide biosynthesis protein
VVETTLSDEAARTRADLPPEPRQTATVTPWEAIKSPSLRNVTLALLVAVLAAALAAAAVLTRNGVYESRTVMEIRSREVFISSGPQEILRLNGLRSKYAALVDSRPIIVPAAEELKLPPGRVAQAARVVLTTDALLMYPTARDHSPREARRIAQQVSDQLRSYVAQEMEQAKVPQNQRVELRVLQPAGPGHKISPQTDRALAVAGFTGLVVLGAAYVLFQLVTAGRRNGTA